MDNDILITDDLIKAADMADKFDKMYEELDDFVANTDKLSQEERLELLEICPKSSRDLMLAAAQHGQHYVRAYWAIDYVISTFHERTNITPQLQIRNGKLELVLLEKDCFCPTTDYLRLLEKRKQ